ncbi:uncharacterized protein BDW70DRAFT_143530 [Aspergillus foveolatus]|uniref:uncharacterized protein n=1 Tax=Aspergillus foveolatus TaxID=210207 RepID=UPI003CCDC83D
MRGPAELCVKSSEHSRCTAPAPPESWFSLNWRFGCLTLLLPSVSLKAPSSISMQSSAPVSILPNCPPRSSSQLMQLARFVLPR